MRVLDEEVNHRMVKKKVVIMAVKTFDWKAGEGETVGGFIARIRKRVVKRLKTEDIYLKVVT